MVRAATRPRRDTYADLEALPEHVVGEIIGGELVVQPRPAPRHARVHTRLGMLLGPFEMDDEPGGWALFDEPEVHLGDDIVVPDLAGWRLERLPDLPETAWFELAPDWVCEVLSPSTERVDRLHKLDIYARERVGHVWLLNPIAKTLEVLRLAGDHWTLVAVHGNEDSPVAIEPFEVLPLDLRKLWRVPERRSE